MRRLGQRTLEFERPTILSHGAVGGKREAEGPLGGDFDQTFGDTMGLPVNFQQYLIDLSKNYQ